jgi:hypothetical protein
MKIKPPSAKNRRIAALKQRHVHYWLLPEKPKKAKRISQLNKLHKRTRRPSEFVMMAISIENEERQPRTRR